MKMSELKEKSVGELSELLMSSYQEELQLRMRQSDGEAAPKPHQYGQVRKKIARIKTIINQKNNVQ
ncbi:MAG: 50S ribosomal protein L29 [Gammaproteobacteria bacterium RIFCSPHIGHO2_12_FULL_42_13]|nr:MAG: 50S ribosomal protein L29 [Gammaproteobacteria bacterium RIFCSPHIGHO2_12_FULL_42_13]